MATRITRGCVRVRVQKRKDMFSLLFDGEDFETYLKARAAYLKAADELKLSAGPYEAAREAYIAAAVAHTKSLHD